MNLILINGLPGVGKTTVAKYISEELDIPLISKDAIKEYLFDTLGVKDRAWSKTLGKASNDFLYVLADKLLSDNHSLILENAFEKEFAESKIKELVSEYHPNFIEIYCFTNSHERRKRFIERNESGERHIGHVDKLNYPSDTEEEPLIKYGALNIGSTLNLDTTGDPVAVSKNAIKYLKNYIKKEE